MHSNGIKSWPSKKLHFSHRRYGLQEQDEWLQREQQLRSPAEYGLMESYRESVLKISSGEEKRRKKKSGAGRMSIASVMCITYDITTSTEVNVDP